MILFQVPDQEEAQNVKQTIQKLKERESKIWKAIGVCISRRFLFIFEHFWWKLDSTKAILAIEVSVDMYG